MPSIEIPKDRLISDIIVAEEFFFVVYVLTLYGSVRLAVFITRKVCEAVVGLHRANLTQCGCDLKCTCMIVSPEGLF